MKKIFLSVIFITSIFNQLIWCSSKKEKSARIQAILATNKLRHSSSQPQLYLSNLEEEKSNEEEKSEQPYRLRRANSLPNKAIPDKTILALQAIAAKKTLSLQNIHHVSAPSQTQDPIVQQPTQRLSFSQKHNRYHKIHTQQPQPTRNSLSKYFCCLRKNCCNSSQRRIERMQEQTIDCCKDGCTDFCIDQCVDCSVNSCVACCSSLCCIFSALCCWKVGCKRR